MKKLFALFLVFSVALTLLVSPAFAAETATCPNCGGQLTFINFDIVISGSETYKCSRCGKYYTSASIFGHKFFEIGRPGSSVSDGSGSIDSPKKYYTKPSSTSSNTVYNGGDTSYYSVVNTQNKTLNYTTYNQTTQNYINNTYTYNNYTYNNEYNYYTYNISNHNYYVTNNYTYVTVVYPDGTQNEDGEDNYDSVDIYYELPDGRNSYDLSPEDIYGTYFVYNVLPYQSIPEDDGVTLGLWHLDGDLKDSSANNGEFSFQSNASTFVDSLDGWGKCLQGTGTKVVFDEDAFPDNVGTLEFRIFVNSSESTVSVPLISSKYEMVASSKNTASSLQTARVTNFSDQNVKPIYYTVYYEDYLGSTGSGTTTSVSLPTNQWNTIAYVLDGQNLNLYVNGILERTLSLVSDSDQFVKVIKDYEWVLWGYDYEWRPVEESDYGFWRTKRTSLDYAAGFSISSNWNIDEVRYSSEVLYTDDYVISQQPFDTNMVLVPPDNPVQYDIGIFSGFGVPDYRIGGVRPTYPTDGYVYVYLENDVIQNVQQYQSDGWYTVEACIYVDGEWRDVKGFNLADAKFEEVTPEPTPTPDPGGEPTPTPDPGGEPTPTPDPGGGEIDPSEPGWFEKFLSMLFDGLSGLFQTISVVLGSILTGIIDLLGQVVKAAGSMVGLGQDFTGVIGQLFGWLPAEMQAVLVGGFALFVTIGLIKIFMK